MTGFSRFWSIWDAAVAGQGLAYELSQIMSLVERLLYGGTIFHFVINNQIGFTTDLMTQDHLPTVLLLLRSYRPRSSMSMEMIRRRLYLCRVSAFEYRQHFNTDVYVDMVCYRKHGHNEGDDPKFTQPAMYELIAKHPDVRTLYINTLAQRGDVKQN